MRARHISLIAITLALSVASANSFAQTELVIRPGVLIDNVDMGGLTKDEAVKRIRLGWETTRRELITLTNPILTKQPEPRTATSWGVLLNDTKTIAQLTENCYWDGSDSSGQLAGIKSYDLVFDFDVSKLESLERWLVANQPPIIRAREDGKVTPNKQTKIYTLNRELTKSEIFNAMQQGGVGKLELTESTTEIKPPVGTVPKDLMATFTTRFPVGQGDRNNNIKVASGKIDGTILQPGDIFSFNETVGKRTIDAGFKEAGVYLNGKHGRGVGGGICQVSTTLYNSVLLADLKIIQRHNHSLPVAYVPLGQDATVSYGTLDFRFQNTTEGPIRIERKLEKGRLTFSIYGQPDEYEVKIVSGPQKSWEHKAQIVKDSKIRAGRRVVIEKGSDGHSLRTYRMVYQDGKLIRKDDLGLSYYGGGPAIIAVGGGRRVASTGGKTPMARGPLAPGVTITPLKAPSGPIIPTRRG
ncbi:MAG: VanW family protein [Armatimonadetes bacterium]|nr:VanW family protein [Armatimonadota bacterium]